MLAAFVFASPAAASVYPTQSYFVAPSPGGADKNDCSNATTPCATLQRAVDLCRPAILCDIWIAPGVYEQRTTVLYSKIIFISGPMTQDGKCSDNRRVVVGAPTGGDPPGGPIFYAQDHSILSITCLTLSARGKGFAGLQTRQFAIGDVSHVRFENFAAGDMLAATETSKINVLDPDIAGGAVHFGDAGGLSQITISGVITIIGHPKFASAFLESRGDSLVWATPSKVVDGNAVSGASYECIHSAVRIDLPLPGGNVPFPGNLDCEVSGQAAPKLVNPIQVQLNALRSSQDEFAHHLHELRRLRRDDNIVAIAVVILLGGIGGFAIWAQRRRLQRIERMIRGLGTPSEAEEIE